MPSREVFRAVQHAACVHKSSMGARNGYSGVVFVRRPPELSRGQPQYVQLLLLFMSLLHGRPPSIGCKGSRVASRLRRWLWYLVCLIALPSQ